MRPKGLLTEISQKFIQRRYHFPRYVLTINILSLSENLRENSQFVFFATGLGEWEISTREFCSVVVTFGYPCPYFPARFPECTCLNTAWTTQNGVVRLFSLFTFAEVPFCSLRSAHILCFACVTSSNQFLISKCKRRHIFVFRSGEDIILGHFNNCSFRENISYPYNFQSILF